MSRRPFKESILIVEDTPFMAEVLKDIFGEDGYEVFWAKDGHEAVAMYPNLLPDLVTLDIVMPGMDGIEVLGELLRLDPSCKAIMVSAIGMEAHVMKAIGMGARNFVVKPFDKDKVLNCVHAALKEY